MSTFLTTDTIIPVSMKLKARAVVGSVSIAAPFPGALTVLICRSPLAARCRGATRSSGDPAEPQKEPPGIERKVGEVEGSRWAAAGDAHHAPIPSF